MKSGQGDKVQFIGYLLVGMKLLHSVVPLHVVSVGGWWLWHPKNAALERPINITSTVYKDLHACQWLSANIPGVFILFTLGVRELVVLFSAQYIQLDEKLAVSVSLIFYLLSLLVASTGLYYLFRPQRLGTDKIPSIKQVENDLEKEN